MDLESRACAKGRSSRGDDSASTGPTPALSYAQSFRWSRSLSYRILIADDHEIVRRGLKSIIAGQTGWEVVAEALTGREAVAMAREHHPELVIMDIAMPELNGLDATRQI